MTSPDRIRRDFDSIATAASDAASGRDRYDALLASLVPDTAHTILDIGSGLGRLAEAISKPHRRIVGVDLSPEMVRLARIRNTHTRDNSFVCDDFLTMHLNAQFDCIISSATLHHMPLDVAIPRIVSAVRPGGRVIIHDLCEWNGPIEAIKLAIAMTHDMLRRIAQTGRPRSSRQERNAWSAHAQHDVYLTRTAVRAMAAKYLGGNTRIIDHWLVRYTLVWDKPLQPD